jgi:hypothetical protein
MGMAKSVPGITRIQPISAKRPSTAILSSAAGAGVGATTIAMNMHGMPISPTMMSVTHSVTVEWVMPALVMGDPATAAAGMGAKAASGRMGSLSQLHAAG